MKLYLAVAIILTVLIWAACAILAWAAIQHPELL